MLRVAVEWECLAKMPKIHMVRQPEKLIVIVSQEHFEKLYREGCELAELPVLVGQAYNAADWWRALLTVARMAGLRIREILALKWEDVNLEAGVLITGTMTTRASGRKRSQYIRSSSTR